MKNNLILFAGLFILFFQGCTVYEPVAEQKMIQLDPTYRFQSSEIDFQDSGKWWETFKDQTLKTLIDKALKNNFEIKKSLAGINQKKASLGAAESATLPDLSAELSSGKSRTVSETNGSVVAQEKSSTSLSLSGSYDLDLFGENAYNLSAARLSVLAAIEDHRTLLSETVADLANTWLTIQELEVRIDLLNREVANDQENLDFIIQRHKLGLSSLTEVLQAQQQLIASKTGLPSLKNELKTNKLSLKLLIGEYPSLDDSVIPIDFNQSIPGINPGIPSDLIKRRSDIRSALLNVKIADNQVGAAIAATFPRISLTASTGTSSEDLKNLTNPDYAVWSLIANITVPILDSEGRKAEVQRQQAVLEEKIISYRSTVFEAFKDVEASLTNIQTQNELIELLQQQVVISKQTIEQTLSHYREGLGDWTDVLKAQTDYFEAEDSLVSAKKELIAQRITLLISLGESWTDDPLTFDTIDSEKQTIMP